MEFNKSEFQLISRHLVMPQHLNPNHHIFGGQLLAWLDKDIYIYVTNVLKYLMFVTVSMNNVYFKKPAYPGEILETYGKIKEVKRTSVTAFGKAAAFDPQTGSSRDIIECELTYVSINEKGKPVRIIPV
ncbi:MAG: acyl-CoA thioesterase [Spirochaetia bacterium]|nr:acyl-CoA thioesterase [Spirochaetia bacterium]